MKTIIGIIDYKVLFIVDNDFVQVVGYFFFHVNFQGKN